jgi:hypothetical protein
MKRFVDCKSNKPKKKDNLRYFSSSEQRKKVHLRMASHIPCLYVKGKEVQRMKKR